MYIYVVWSEGRDFWQWEKQELGFDAVDGPRSLGRGLGQVPEVVMSLR